MSYRLTIEWSDEITDVSYHTTAAKAAHYLETEARLAATTAEVLELGGENVDMTYVEDYTGKVAVRIVSATLEEE